MKRVILALSIAILLAIPELTAQQERTTRSDEAYGARFFDQLRTIFGRFRESDLQRVFQDAQPIQCSELVGRKGQWRPVAFFNEDRSLGGWCRDSLEEVKTDLAVYTFKGNCSGERGTVQVETEYPTSASLEEFRQRKISLDQVDITVNDPVNAALDSRTMAYKFELPYLFLTSDRNSKKIYSYIAPDRNAAYATDMTSRWECKAVASRDVTYRFLICRVAIFPRGKPARNQKWEPSFGSSAFFILSDGTEAQTKVNMTFGDGTKPAEKPADTAEPEAPTGPARPVLKRE
jgi:hypothetical protein